MDENASRAVFLGVSVFVAIITITLILSFYRTAKDSAAVANRYDITETGNSRVNDILAKTQITGLELRYLMNYFDNDDSVRIYIYQPGINNGNEYNPNLQADYQLDIDQVIKPNYNYGLAVDSTKAIINIVATFEN